MLLLWISPGVLIVPGAFQQFRFYRIRRGARKMEATTCDQTVRPAMAEMISTLARRMGTRETGEGWRRRGSLGGSANLGTSLDRNTISPSPLESRASAAVDAPGGRRVESGRRVRRTSECHSRPKPPAHTPWPDSIDRTFARFRVKPC